MYVCIRNRFLSTDGKINVAIRLSNLIQISNSNQSVILVVKYYLSHLVLCYKANTMVFIKKTSDMNCLKAIYIQKVTWQNLQIKNGK